MQLDEFVEDAQVNAEKGLGELKKAKDYSDRSRKCTCCLVKLIVIALLIAAVIIYFTMFHGKEDKKD